MINNFPVYRFDQNRISEFLFLFLGSRKKERWKKSLGLLALKKKSKNVFILFGECNGRTRVIYHSSSTEWSTSDPNIRGIFWPIPTLQMQRITILQFWNFESLDFWEFYQVTMTLISRPISSEAYLFLSKFRHAPNTYQQPFNVKIKDFLKSFRTKDLILTINTLWSVNDGAARNLLQRGSWQFFAKIGPDEWYFQPQTELM